MFCEVAILKKNYVYPMFGLHVFNHSILYFLIQKKTKLIFHLILNDLGSTLLIFPVVRIYIYISIYIYVDT